MELSKFDYWAIVAFALKLEWMHEEIGIFLNINEKTSRRALQAYYETGSPIKKNGKSGKYPTERISELLFRKKKEPLSTLHKVGIIELARAQKTREEIATQMKVGKNTVTSVIEDFKENHNPRTQAITKPSKSMFLDHKDWLEHLICVIGARNSKNEAVSLSDLKNALFENV